MAFTPPPAFGFHPDAWKVIELKARDLTNTLSFLDPETWLAKKVFRLTVPALVRLFHLDARAVVAIQYVLGFLLTLHLYWLSKRILKDSVSATLITAGLSLLYFGRACFSEVYFTWFDGWAFFLLIAAMFYRNPLLAFIFATAAAWTDERAFVALPIALLYHQLADENGIREGRSPRHLFSPAPPTLAILAAMACYLGFRWRIGAEF